MCARYTLTAPAARVADLFDMSIILDLKPRYNIAPTQQVQAIRTDAEGKREAVT